MVDEDLEVDGEEGLALAHCPEREPDDEDKEAGEDENEDTDDGDIGCFVWTLAALEEGVASVARFAGSAESPEVASAARSRRREGVIIFGSGTSS